MADFLRHLEATTLRICQEAQRVVERSLESRTLRRALRCRLDPQVRNTITARLSVPHYWAVYYHDGRGPVRPRRGKFLVYFRSIEDDPRVRPSSASPERYSQTRRLQLRPETFRRLVAQGKLIVRTGVGPAAPHPFFRSLDDLSSRVGTITEPAISQFVLADLKEAGILNLRIEGRFDVR